MVFAAKRETHRRGTCRHSSNPGKGNLALSQEAFTFTYWAIVSSFRVGYHRIIPYGVVLVEARQFQPAQNNIGMHILGDRHFATGFRSQRCTLKAERSM